MNQMTTALAIDRSASHARPSQIMAEVLWGLAALLVIGLVGGLKLFMPFDGDQALFLLMAEAIDRGERLYVASSGSSGPAASCSASPCSASSCSSWPGCWRWR